MSSGTSPSAALTSPRSRSSEPRRFNSLPAELLSRILCFLGPCDIIHLRLVSKLFHDITYDPLIWKTIYSNACLPRPSGPFPSQSQRFLERTLIRSERLAKCWTTHPIQTISNTRVRLQCSSVGQPKIVGGRWIVTLESYRQIVIYDIETLARQVLWEDTELITAWDVCSIISAGGFLVYVVIRKSATKQDLWCAPWTLLEFRVHGESGDLAHSASVEIPTKLYWQSVCLIADKAPFLYIMGRHLIFDTRTRAFYEFPEFSSGIGGVETHHFLVSHRRVLLTTTHIVVVSYPLQQHGISLSPAEESTLVQTFVLPTGTAENQDANKQEPRNENGTRSLHLSHEGVTPERLANLVLIRNSTTDSETGVTQLRFLRLQPEGDHLWFSCVDLALPCAPAAPVSLSGGSTGPVPLMKIDLTNVFAVQGGVYDPSISSCGYLIEASEDGYVRGCCQNRIVEDGGPLLSGSSMSSSWFTNFTIDATGKECVAVVGQVSPPLWARSEDGEEDGNRDAGQNQFQGPPSFSTLSFDGVMGRFCYLKSGGENRSWRMRGCVDLVVADIK